jgi:hypothetical protein
MSYFAKVVQGKVVDIVSAEPEFFETFVDSTPGNWIQTSYNTKGGIHYDPVERDVHGRYTPSEDQSKALRYNFAGIGYFYDRSADAFYEQQPFPSWKLDTDTYLWVAPLQCPELTSEQIDQGCVYDWDEDAHQADNTTGWVLLTPDSE